VENLLAVLATMLALKIPLPEAAQAMAEIRPVAGRMERIGYAKGRPAVFVDYAHTPDALAKALSSLKEHCRQSLWVVFGCGGDRDRGKRFEMGRIAGQWANRIVLTDDNPRSEASDKIINDILLGCQTEKTEVIPDRKTAIKSVLNRAASADWILIAGKGHEDYQEIKGVRVPFSDHMIVRESLSMANGQAN
jgi:UDP-N-acetylmuramoyl-L-alanyl-D-glutamate--2,6-diaminopimelate ligase